MSRKPKYPVLPAESWSQILAMSPTAAKELFAESVRQHSVDNMLNAARAGYATSAEGDDYLKSMILACLQRPIAEKVLPTWLEEIEKRVTADEFQAKLRTQLRRVAEARGVEAVVDVARILVSFGADPFYENAVPNDRGYSFEPSGIESAIKEGNLLLFESYLEGLVFDAEHPMPTFAHVSAVETSSLHVGFEFPRRNLISLIADGMTSLTSLEESLALVREHVAPGYMEPFHDAFDYGLDSFVSDPNAFARRRKALCKIHEIVGGATPRPASPDGIVRPADWGPVLTLPANEQDLPFPYFCASSGAEQGALALERLINEGGLDVNAVDAKYGTLLHTAAWSDSATSVQKLLELGANASLRTQFPTARDDGEAMTAVEVAELAGHEDIAKMIHAHSAHTAISNVLGRIKPHKGNSP